MNWKDLASDVAKFAPAIGGVLAGPAGGAAGTVLASVFGAENDAQAVSEAIQADPKAAAKLKAAEMGHAAEMRRMVLEAETTRLAEINKTMRAELATDDKYKTWWRPTFGYMAAITWFVQGLAIVYAIIAEPMEAPKIIEAIASLGMMWSVALAVLGVQINARSKDKQTATGQVPQGLLSKFLK